MINFKVLLKYFYAGFFVFAGLNHFINPQFYYPLIPDYLPFHGFLNISSGVLEIIFGIGLLFAATRRWSAYGIIALMILFVPSHIYFSMEGACFEGSICIPVWASWMRLIVIQPLIIYGAWIVKEAE